MNKKKFALISIVLLVCLLVVGGFSVWKKLNNDEGIFYTDKAHYDEAGYIVFNSDCCRAEKDAVMSQDFYQSAADASSIKPDDIAIGKLYLNDDNLTDFVAMFGNSYFCGSGGCHVYFFIQAEDGEYTHLKTQPSVANSFKVSETVTNGFHGLLFPERSGAHHCLWQWDSFEYEFKGCEH